MTTETELIDVERAGWAALATSADAARDHFERVLTDPVLMLLPGGLVIDDRRRAVDSMSGAPWDRFELDSERVLWLDPGAAVVAYRATAQRGSTDYAAWCNSTYMCTDGTWRMALHQQTPS